jgi:hypothetical protein
MYIPCTPSFYNSNDVIHEWQVDQNGLDIERRSLRENKLHFQHKDRLQEIIQSTSAKLISLEKPKHQTPSSTSTSQARKLSNADRTVSSFSSSFTNSPSHGSPRLFSMDNVKSIMRLSSSVGSSSRPSCSKTALVDAFHSSPDSSFARLHQLRFDAFIHNMNSLSVKLETNGNGSDAQEAIFRLDDAELSHSNVISILKPSPHIPSRLKDAFDIVSEIVLRDMRGYFPNSVDESRQGDLDALNRFSIDKVVVRKFQAEEQLKALSPRSSTATTSRGSGEDRRHYLS